MGKNIRDDIPIFALIAVVAAIAYEPFRRAMTATSAVLMTYNLVSKLEKMQPKDMKDVGKIIGF